MAEVGTPTPLLKHAELATHLRVSESTIDNYIQRYPAGSPHAFPVQYVGRNRRYELAEVKAWFAAHAAGFEITDAASTSAA